MIVDVLKKTSLKNIITNIKDIIFKPNNKPNEQNKDELSEFTDFEKTLLNIFNDMANEHTPKPSSIKNKQDKKKVIKNIEQGFSLMLPELVQECIFNPNSPQTQVMLQTKKNKTIGVELINGKIEIVNFTKFQRQINKYTKQELENQIIIMNSKFQEEDKFNFPTNEIKFDFQFIKPIITQKRIDMMIKKNPEQIQSQQQKQLKQPKTKTQKLEQILHGPPKPTPAQLEINKYNFTKMLNERYGNNIGQIITNKYQLTKHFHTIDEQIYFQVENQSRQYKNNLKVSRNDIKQARKLLDYIKHTWGTTQYSMLNDIKKLARETIKTNQTKNTQNTLNTQTTNTQQKKINLENTLTEQNTLTNETQFEDFHFDSFYEVLEHIENKYQENIIIPDYVRKKAKKNKFQNHKESYNVLTCLLTSCLDAFSNENNNSGREKIEILIKQASKFNYAPRQKIPTINRFPQDYTTKHNGKTIELHKHLTFGSNTTEEKMIRIGFEPLTDEKKILIGYIGRHPRS